MNKQIVYYTCNTHRKEIEQACRQQLLKAGLPIISVSLNKVIDFGDTRLTLSANRSPETMHSQILYGLRDTFADAIFLCESDVLYHPSHFDFIPPRDDTFYFNTNVYKCWPDGLTVWTDDLQQLSGMCASRNLMFIFFEHRLEQIEREGFNRHYEPGPRYGCKTENWMSEYPNLDIRHRNTLTKSHRSVEEFRNPKFARGFKVLENVPYWNHMKPILEEVSS